MRSMMVLTLRVLIMLGCLVTLPMVAVLGTDLPQLMRDTWEQRGLGRVTVPVAAPSQSTPSAPPAVWPPPETPAAAEVNSEVQSTEPQPLATEPSQASAIPQQPLQFPGSEAASQPLASTPLGVQPPSAGGSAAGNVQPAAATMPAAGDPFVAIQQRLRELGATYYRLETWGRNGQLYRFQCQMAVDGNPQMTQHFEATEVDALRAMETVARQVDAWRQSQLR